MGEFCFVVERIDWEEQGEPYDYWERRDVCRVCRSEEDARSFCENNSCMSDIPMSWKGSMRYSGRLDHGDGYVEGLAYELHYVALF